MSSEHSNLPRVSLVVSVVVIIVLAGFSGFLYLETNTYASNLSSESSAAASMSSKASSQIGSLQGQISSDQGKISSQECLLGTISQCSAFAGKYIGTKQCAEGDGCQISTFKAERAGYLIVFGNSTDSGTQIEVDETGLQNTTAWNALIESFGPQGSDGFPLAPGMVYVYSYAPCGYWGCTSYNMWVAVSYYS